MKSRKSRTVTLVSALVGMLLFALVALNLEESIRERWWRWRLHSSNVVQNRQAARAIIRMARARAARGLERGDHASVLRWLLRAESWFRRAGSTEIEIAYLIAESYFHLGDFDAAIPYYRSVLDVLPGPPLEDDVIKRLYAIGLAFIQEEAGSKPGGPIARSRKSGANFLLGRDGLLDRYPFSFEADRALMDIADLSLGCGAYDAARQAYERLVREHPGSDRVEAARFGAAVAFYRSIRGPRTPLQLSEAQSRFELYCRQHPAGAKIDEARSYLLEIEESGSEVDAVFGPPIPVDGSPRRLPQAEHRSSTRRKSRRVRAKEAPALFTAPR